MEDACSTYAEHVKVESGASNADDLTARYRRWVNLDPIGKVELAKLTKKNVLDWHHRLVNAPIKRNGANTNRESSKDTVNRDMSALRAALN
ncbi:hypothetical protein N5K27_21250, partial [Pigmentiphaga sp. GD03639]|nr:hypothetical protein [Pigmentiphaga sp. GD03639]